jgi:4-phospho-D-threonate 3-dehydrogenase / 4-phospho-D-erythronate 3-dehydrogenase
MRKQEKPAIAVTMGDPSGIGPEIVVRAVASPEVAAFSRLLVLGDRGALERAIAGCNVDLRIEEAEVPPAVAKPGVLYLRSVAELAESERVLARPSVAGGDAAYRSIRQAAELCMEGTTSAMATAPINKEALNRAGHHYPGHTELLAELTDTADFVMMLAGERLRVSLVTIHEALSAVPRLVTYGKVLSTIRITHTDVDRYFRRNPRIAVLALNPHCGEGGMFGDEETRVIRPAVEQARREGIDAVGPLSADTLYHFAARGEYDAVVAMYHDQGLIPLKLLHFDDGVNITLGLPIIRTSVDHGTAYELAGTGKASAASMIAAVRTAAAMAGVRAATSGDTP